MVNIEEIFRTSADVRRLEQVDLDRLGPVLAHGRRPGRLARLFRARRARTPGLGVPAPPARPATAPSVAHP